MYTLQCLVEGTFLLRKCLLDSEFISTRKPYELPCFESAYGITFPILLLSTCAYPAYTYFIFHSAFSLCLMEILTRRGLNLALGCFIFVFTFLRTPPTVLPSLDKTHAYTLVSFRRLAIYFFLCSPGYPVTHSVEQAGLEHTVIDLPLLH